MAASKKVLETALDLVGGDRAIDYGSMWENHQNIAQLWNGYLHDKNGNLSAEDAANMMELLKIARRKSGALKKDNYIDGAGYAAVAFECAERDRDNQLSFKLLAEKYSKKNNEKKS